MNDERKVVIVGSGISGLSMLLGLRKYASQANVKVVLYTSQTKEDFTDLKTWHMNLWKSGIEAAMELGIGKRLCRVSWPIVKLKSVEVETDEVLVDWPSEEPRSTANDELDYLPPLVGLRKVDLIRALMTSAAGRTDLVDDSMFAVRPANNADSCTDPKTGIEADLARGNWFEDENFEAMLPDIIFGHKLESYVISAEYGSIYLKFQNGVKDKAFMLLGCDGAESVVRSLLFNDRLVAQHTQQLHIHGITPLNAPPIDAPLSLPDGTPIQHLTRSSLLSFAPDGSCHTWIDKTLSFGISNIGNDCLGWNLIVKQDKPGSQADQFTMPRRRSELGQSMTYLMPPSTLPRAVSGGSSGDWQVPSDSNPNTPRDSKTAAAQPIISQLPPIAFVDAFGSDNLSGSEARDLALHLCSNPSLPRQIVSVIAATNVLATGAVDNIDLYGDDVFKSYTSPLFHPGRVMLVGDACHALATSSHGSHGASMALCDAVILSKLIGFFLSPHGSAKVLATASVNPTENSTDAIVLEHISRRYTELRMAVGSQAISDSRAEATWTRQEPGFWKSLLRVSGANTWARTTFQGMMDRGKMDVLDLTT